MTMESLIKGVRAINGFIFLLFILFSCNVQKKHMDSNQSSYRIIFGDGFNNDIIKLFVNDVIVFQNEKLFSDKSDGVTNSWLNISQNSKYFFVSSSQNKEFKQIGLISDVVNVSIVHKGKTTNFKINNETGKYIIISDDGQGNLILSQSKDKPIFD